MASELRKALLEWLKMCILKLKNIKKDSGLIVLSNLEDLPKMTVIFNTINELELTEKIIASQQTNFHSKVLEW